MRACVSMYVLIDTEISGTLSTFKVRLKTHFMVSFCGITPVSSFCGGLSRKTR